MLVRSGVRAALLTALALASAPGTAVAAGVPELFTADGYLELRETRVGDDEVTNRVARIDPRSGRREAEVDVLTRLDPTYTARRLDGIAAAVRCQDTLWLVRATYTTTAFGNDVSHRLYRVSATESAQVSSPDIDATFSARDLACGRDGSVYVEGSRVTSERAYDVFLRVAEDGTVAQRIEPGRWSGNSIVTRSGVAFLDRRAGVIREIRLDGTQRDARLRYRKGLRNLWALGTDGTRTYVLEHLDGPGWVRSATQRSRGQFYDGINVNLQSTHCGGLVVTRGITLSRTEVAFVRHGRIIRHVASGAAPKTIDAATGTVALLGRVYSACGDRAGRVRTTLRGGAQATRLIGVAAGV